MNDDIKELCTNLREMALIEIIRELGYEVTTVPTWSKHVDGREFVWHKPFISADEASRAWSDFRRGAVK